MSDVEAQLAPVSDAGAAWPPQRAEPDGLSPEELDRWRTATSRVRGVAEARGWSQSEVARRAGIPSGTFSGVYHGSYRGRIPAQVDLLIRFADSLDESTEAARGSVAAPGYVETRTSAELWSTLVYAQTLGEMAVVTLGAGMGKTMTAEEYARRRPHAHIVTMRPTTKNVSNMLQEIGRVLGVPGLHRRDLDTAIAAQVRRNGRDPLLIIDEAQHLQDEAVNQLRYFLDVSKCGIVLLGNEELYGRFGGTSPKAAYAQLHRRVGKRLKRMRPLAADIEVIIAAWGVAEAEAVGLLRAIGNKPGALSQISKTMMLASLICEGQPVTAAHIRRAWENRGGDEEMR